MLLFDKLGDKKGSLLLSAAAAEKANSGRIDLIDFLRGGGMLLVLLHHAGFPLGSYILAFHMPLFFVLSGYLEYKRDSICKNGFGHFIKNRVFRLFVPYFCFEIINCAIFLCGNLMTDSKAMPTLWEIVYSIICVNTDAYTGFCGRLWFLPCMFVSDIFMYLLLNVSKKAEKHKKSMILIFIGIMFFLSFLTTHVIQNRLPFTIDTSFFATAFILIGYFFGKAIDYLIGDDHYDVSIGILFLSLSGLYLTVRSGYASVLMLWGILIIDCGCFVRNNSILYYWKMELYDN